MAEVNESDLLAVRALINATARDIDTVQDNLANLRFMATLRYQRWDEDLYTRTQDKLRHLREEMCELKDIEAALLQEH